MLSGIEKRRISKRDRKVKVKNFPGATIDDMCDYIKSLLKCPDNIILHVGTKNTVNEPSKTVLDKLLKVGLSRLRKLLPNQNFSQPCSRKYYNLFVWWLKLTINEFENCKICFLKKQADLKTNCTRL